MAARKPKGIVSPWLGASKNITVAGKTSVNSTGSSEAQIDTGGGERDKVNETLMLGIAGAAGVTAAAIGARRSGLPVRVVRAVTGRNTSYFVHGSPTPNIRKLDPKYETMPNMLVSDPRFSDRWPGGVDVSKANVYGQPITKVVGQKGSANVLQPRNVVQESIKDAYRYGRFGSLYIAKAPRQKVGFDADDAITSTAKVVKEIKVSGKTRDQVVREAEKALRKLGFRYPKQR